MNLKARHDKLLGAPRRRWDCGLGLAPGGREDKQISIAFVSGPLNDSFFPPLYQGAQDAAKALGVKLNYIPIDEADIEASSARTMQAAIAQNPDAIVVGDFITSVVDPLIKQAVAAGIPVYVNQSGQDQWKADGAFGFVGSRGREVGRSPPIVWRRAPRTSFASSTCRAIPIFRRSATGSPARQELGIASANLELPTADSTDQARCARHRRLYAVP